MSSNVRLITVYREAVCLTCEELVEFGSQAYWVPQVGVWHTTCRRPANLDLYAREAETRARLEAHGRGGST